MKIKTSELAGIALRWAVATCEGLGYRNDEKYGLMFFRPTATPGVVHWDSSPLPYDTDWSVGGPIIEREGIGIAKEENDLDWVAWTFQRDDAYWCGPTPPIAAMRCYVASKLGDEVDVPEELLEQISKI